MNLKIGLAWIIQLQFLSAVIGLCPESWMTVGNKCVHVSSDPMTWWESHDYCASLNTTHGHGMLASMPDCLNFAELTYYMGYISPVNGSFWVGAHSEFTAHNWKWLTLEPLRTGVPFWAYTEGHGNGEDCAAMESKYYYQLADDDCEAKKGAVCMIDLETAEFNRFERPRQLLDCPRHTTQVGDHCYRFSTYDSTWSYAKDKCQNPSDHHYHRDHDWDNHHYHRDHDWDYSHPGELFSPSTCEEFSHMAHHLETQGSTKYWVGAVDVTGYHEWSWVSGDTIPSGAPYWAYGEPNHKEDGQARTNCAIMDPSKRRYLSDESCRTKHRYICEVFIQ